MKKIQYIFIFFIFIFIQPIYAEDSVDLTKDVGKKYKIDKEKDSLSCFIPLAIKDIDTIYIKNDKDQAIYTIEIWGSEGNCKWERDKILFEKNLSRSEINYVLRNYKQKIYFNGNFQILFKVKKLLPNENINIKNIKVPYFVLINNKKSNEIIFKKDLTINIDLPSYGEKIYEGEKISLKESYLAEEFINLETLSGIYFKKASKK